MMLRFTKPWAYIQNGSAVSVPTGFEGDIPEEHVQSAVDGGYAVRVNAPASKPKAKAKAKPKRKGK